MSRKRTRSLSAFTYLDPDGIENLSGQTVEPVETEWTRDQEQQRSRRFDAKITSGKFLNVVAAESKAEIKANHRAQISPLSTDDLKRMYFFENLAPANRCKTTDHMVFISVNEKFNPLSSTCLLMG